jgi:hypothetical protein
VSGVGFPFVVSDSQNMLADKSRVLSPAVKADRTLVMNSVYTIRMAVNCENTEPGDL